MDDLRLMLILVGAFAIVAVLIHGLWMNKRENSSVFDEDKSKNSNKSTYKDLYDYGDDNKGQPVDPLITDLQQDMSLHASLSESDTPNKEALLYTTESELPSKSMPDPVIINNAQQPAESEPEIRENKSESEVDELSDLPRNSDETLLDENNLKAPENDLPEANAPEMTENTEQPPEKPLEKMNDVIVLHVVSMYGDMIHGDVLYPSLLNAGFCFGEMQIFHRHVNIAGDGDVLFSLANMVKPGTLHPDNMPYLATPGVTIFMSVPSFGDSLQNFKLMLQTVQQIADDVEGRVLDEERHMLTPQKINVYKERIREVMKSHEQITD